MTIYRPSRVAIAQITPVFLNLPASVAVAEHAVRRAASEGAQIIALPETFLPGYTVWADYAPGAAMWGNRPATLLYRRYFENALVIGDEHFNRLGALAAELSVYLSIGASERLGQTLYNSMFLFMPHGTWVVHRKLMPTFSEKLIWGTGDGSTLPVVESPFGRIGGLICWEHWMPLARAAMHAQGEHIHLAPWSHGSALHQLASRQYAFESQAHVLLAGNYLTLDAVLEGYDSLPADPAGREFLAAMGEGANEGNHLLRGGSAVIGPDTEYVIEPVYDREEILHAEVDPQRTTEGRLVMDAAGHYSRPDVFQLTVDRAARLTGSGVS